MTRTPFLVLSRKIVERFLFLRLSPPGDRLCDVLGFVPAGSCLKILYTSDLPRRKPPVRRSTLTDETPLKENFYGDLAALKRTAFVRTTGVDV